MEGIDYGIDWWIKLVGPHWADMTTKLNKSHAWAAECLIRQVRQEAGMELDIYKWRWNCESFERALSMHLSRTEMGEIWTHLRILKRGRWPSRNQFNMFPTQQTRFVQKGRNWSWSILLDALETLQPAVLTISTDWPTQYCSFVLDKVLSQSIWPHNNEL